MVKNMKRLLALIAALLLVPCMALASSRVVDDVGLFSEDEIAKMEELIASMQEAYQMDVVVLTIPQDVAQDTANRLIEMGVHGFWNFTNVELSSAKPDVKFENIHFADSLLTLSYRIANR